MDHSCEVWSKSKDRFQWRYLSKTGDAHQTTKNNGQRPVTIAHTEHFVLWWTKIKTKNQFNHIKSIYPCLTTAPPSIPPTKSSSSSSSTSTSISCSSPSSTMKLCSRQQATKTAAHLGGVKGNTPPDLCRHLVNIEIKLCLQKLLWQHS